MKKTLFLAIAAFALLSMSSVQASPVPSVASHESVSIDASFNQETSVFVITTCHYDDMIIVEQLQLVDFYSEPVSNQKETKAFKVSTFNGSVFKPPLCNSNLQLSQSLLFKIYSGNRYCFIRNPSKLIC